MPSPSSPSRAEIDRQASIWAARLESGPFRDRDRDALAAWLEAEPEHRCALARYREMCAQLAAQVPVLADAEEVEALAARVAAHHRWRRIGGRVLAAAAVLALAAGLWHQLPEKMETRSAERRALALADGSRLELNAQTQLEVSLGRQERRVTLGRGEAFFRVAHDARRPFVVATPAGAVRVTGTVFNVRAGSAGQAEVTVLEGSVQLQPAVAPGSPVPVPLAAGQQAVLGAAHLAVRSLSPEAAQNVTAWRVGQVAFESEPLAAALERFSTYHPRSVTVAAEAAALRVGGRYSLDDLDGFLAALEQALPVSVLHGTGGAVRVVARPRPRP